MPKKTTKTSTARKAGGTRTKTSGLRKTKKMPARTGTKKTAAGTKTSGKPKMSRTRAKIGATPVATRSRAKRTITRASRIEEVVPPNMSERGARDDVDVSENLGYDVD